MSTPRAQLRSIRREMERDLLKRDRETLRRLRDELKAAKRERTRRVREVAASCRVQRRRITERAKQARIRLRASIERTREKARGLCQLARGDATREGLEHIERAVGALNAERAQQQSLKIWTRPKVCPTGGRTAREKRAESDCEVEANIDDPGLRVVWHQVKHRIKPGKRRTRTEAFLEWAAEHTSEVYAIQEADAVRALEQLEREERRLAGQVKKATRYRKKSPEELAKLLADVPF